MNPSLYFLPTSPSLQLIILGVTLPMLRSSDMSWQDRVKLSLPALLFPLLSSAFYTLCSRWNAYRECMMRTAWQATHTRTLETFLGTLKHSVSTWLTATIQRRFSEP